MLAVARSTFGRNEASSAVGHISTGAGRNLNIASRTRCRPTKSTDSMSTKIVVIVRRRSPRYTGTLTGTQTNGDKGEEKARRLMADELLQVVVFELGPV